MPINIDKETFASLQRGRRPYIAVLDFIRDEIDRGRLKPGEQLPPQRNLAKSLGLAVGTITKAYSEAARERLVSTEVGRGTFVLGHTGTPNNDVLYDLAFNHLAYEDIHPAELGRTLSRSFKRLSRPGSFSYNPATDDFVHRSHAAQWLRAMGHDAGAERIIICNSTQHGLSLVLQSLASGGDVVMTEQLGYPGIGLLKSVLGFQLRGVAMDSNGLTMDSLKQVCLERQARILVCTPTLHNPTNSIIPFDRRKELAKFARDQDLIIVEYDVNGIAANNALPSLTILAPERTYSLTSTWKSTGMGASLGYIVAPPEAVERLHAVVQATTWTPSPLLRELVTAWIADGTAERVMEWQKSEITKRLDIVKPILDGLEYRCHPASYHIWLSLPEPWRREIFVEALIDHGVSVSPADLFIVGRSIAPHAIRLSMGGIADVSRLATAVHLISETLRKGPQPRIVTA